MESSKTTGRRFAALLYWAAPPALCLALYWPGLRAWFQMDDFAWLGLTLSVHGPRDLLHALFAPMAQGTIRPLSERGFFLLMEALFGLWALPYRACVFLTQFASLALLSWISRRITGSALAGFLAPVLWTVNVALVLPLAWTSAWNQVLCGFFLLLAFACLLCYIDTGKRAWLAGQWTAFLLGLLTLELAAVYPALAALYCLCCARRRLRSTLPLFAASVGYAALHFWLARPSSSANPAYAADFGWPMLHTLGAYWMWALNVSRLPEFTSAPLPRWALAAASAALTAGLLGFAGWQTVRRKPLAAFLLGWFLLLILPVLPLDHHLTQYYLALPVIGLAMLGAWGLQAALGAGWLRAVPTLLLAAIFIGSGCLEARRGARATAERSYRVRTLLYGILRVRNLHPDKAIVLTGVDNELFWASIFHRPFRVLGVSDVFLAPGQPIRTRPEQLQPFVLPPDVLLAALRDRCAVAYAVEPRRLRAVTWTCLAQARARWKTGDPRRVETGQLAFAGQFGPTWYNAEPGHRWMPKQATVWLGGPRTAGAKLLLSGYCPAIPLAGKPLALRLAADGKPLPELFLCRCGSEFHLAVPLPPELVGRRRVEISLQVDRTFRVPGDARELGLAFGSFEIRE